METSIYEPKTNPNELRIAKRRSNRTPEDYPKYNMIPQSIVMVNMLGFLAKLNGAIKFQNCPIRKSPFYMIKSRIIDYFLTVVKAGQAPADWSYRFNGLEEAPENPGHLLAAIELIIDDAVFPFHTPVDYSLLSIMYDQIYKAPVGEFKSDPHMPMSEKSILDVWDALLQMIEYNNWFFLEQTIVPQWTAIIKNWYPHLKIGMAKGTNLKLATMIAGGPMIQMEGKDICKFYEFRDNFHNILCQHGHEYGYRLNIKKL